MFWRTSLDFCLCRLTKRNHLFSEKTSFCFFFSNRANGVGTQVRGRIYMGRQPTTWEGKPVHTEEERWRTQVSNPRHPGDNCHSLPLGLGSVLPEKMSQVYKVEMCFLGFHEFEEGSRTKSVNMLENCEDRKDIPNAC